MPTDMKSSVHFTICILWIIVSVVHSSNKLPASFKRCSQTDPRLNDCLRVAVEDAFNKMIDGVPKLGILSLNPLQVMDITISSNGAVSIEKMQFKNITIHGLKGTKILSYNAKLKDFSLLTESYTEELRMEGDYTIEGRILLLPITGAGRSNITLTRLLTNHELYGEPKIKDNKLHMILKKYDVTFKPKRVSFRFENLFNGDRRLGETMNKFMNDNWELMFSELKGPFQDAFGEVFKEVSNRLFSRVSFDDIFLKNK